MNDTQLFAELERFAASYPWQKVSIWVQRTPEGKLDYVAYLYANDQMGMAGNSCTKPTVTEAIDQLMRETPPQDPENRRLAKIRELELQLAKLRMVQVGLPPYVPSLQLGYSNPGSDKEEHPSAIDVPSSSEEVPF